MTLLILGFSVQLGLFSYMKMSLKKSYNSTGVATTTGVSTGTMLACCLHHLVEILPFMGLTVLSVFINEYQQNLFLFGILSSLVGITFMLNKMQESGQIPSRFNFNLNMKVIRKIVIIFATLIFLLSFIFN